jgi:hypothetical protein
MVRQLLHVPEAEQEIEAQRQRIVKRNWWFSSLPAILLCVVLLDLAWEVLRQNMCTTVWPWTITVLGVAPSATLFGLFTSLLLAREQFARSMRPNLSWRSVLQDSDLLNGRAWTAHLMNFGPGIANVISIRYTVVGREESSQPSVELVSRNDAAAALVAHGLHEGRDFHLTLITGGAPLPVAKHIGEGIQFAALREGALQGIRRLDFHIVVVDVMGDYHAKALPFVATLPRTRVHAAELQV